MQDTVNGVDNDVRGVLEQELVALFVLKAGPRPSIFLRGRTPAVLLRIEPGHSQPLMAIRLVSSGYACRAPTGSPEDLASGPCRRLHIVSGDERSPERSSAHTAGSTIARGCP